MCAVWGFQRFLPPHPSPLPKGEGATSTALLSTRRARLAERQAAILPLPKGEGRGEGEGCVCPSHARNFFNRFMHHRFRLALVLLALCLVAPGLHAADKIIKLKLGTLAPAGTSYHKSLQAMGEKWRKASDGAVQLVIFPGGTQGSEADMVGLMQTGNLDAGLLTADGLSQIDPAALALQVMPMVFRNLDEVDFVGEKLRPQLEARLLAKGYIVLFWSDSGWVRFFSKSPVVHPDDLRKLKVFSWAGNTDEYDLWKASGFSPVALEASGIPQGLLSGTISAVPTVPIFALAAQLDSQAKYMLEIELGAAGGRGGRA